MNKSNAVRKPRAAGKPQEKPAPTRQLVGHGGVIDLHAYTAPRVVRTERMEAYFGYLVRRLDNKIYASFLATLAAEEITPARFTALCIIGANPGVRQVDIARVLDVARPAALKLVNQLIDLGLVEAHPVPSDKRIGALALSAKGQARLGAYEQAVRKHETRICDPLTAHERETLTRLLRKLL